MGGAASWCLEVKGEAVQTRSFGINPRGWVWVVSPLDCFGGFPYVLGWAKSFHYSCPSFLSTFSVSGRSFWGRVDFRVLHSPVFCQGRRKKREQEGRKRGGRLAGLLTVGPSVLWVLQPLGPLTPASRDVSGLLAIKAGLELSGGLVSLLGEVFSEPSWPSLRWGGRD